MNPIVLIVGAIAVVILAIGIFSSYRERGQVQDRLERFVESDRGAVEAAKPARRSGLASANASRGRSRRASLPPPPG